MRHSFFFEPTHEGLLSELQTFASHTLQAILAQALDDEAMTIAVVRALGKAGLLMHTVPSPYGGLSPVLDSRKLCLTREALAYVSALADTAFAMQGLGSYPITLAGNDAQKSQWLPRVASGEALAAFAITEPDAGSDVSSLACRAERTHTDAGEGFVLNGVKRFISNAGIADFYVLFARTGTIESKHRGISAFILPARTPGLTVSPIPLIAPHPIGELHLKDCFLPLAALLGTEGQGFSLAMQTLDRFRPTVGAAALGLAHRALDEALDYVHKRHQFGQALVEHQATRMRLADMALELEAARLLVFQAAWIKDTSDDRASREAAMGKLFATEAAQRIIDSALQLHGGNGVVTGVVVERLYREIRALRIYEGTSEIQKLVIGAELSKSYRRTHPA